MPKPNSHHPQRVGWGGVNLESVRQFHLWSTWTTRIAEHEQNEFRVSVCSSSRRLNPRSNAVDVIFQNDINRVRPRVQSSRRATHTDGQVSSSLSSRGWWKSWQLLQLYARSSPPLLLCNSKSIVAINHCGRPAFWLIGELPGVRGVMLVRHLVDHVGLIRYKR